MFGLHSYLVSRHGMEILLDMWWPGGAAAAMTGGEGLGEGLHFDFTFAGRIFSESLILNVPGVRRALWSA